MQHTFQIKSSNLNSNFIESVRAMFGDKELKIIVEDVEKNTAVTQKELYKKSLPVIDRFRNVTVDSNLDLSALANEVNL
ncbi:hypothetical protein [Dyadobacter sp. CY323]|uniref:hypothetical protein n=1 Tax=Dyadobacter sp. CY323 TaxID=2907302 RepID=UPI001F1B09C3|nr:hypothetical protein [Dyadobacter sp. CY323]MCE6988016.1 hypothetical protein [Dyadobacter sp. CY323]